MNRHVNTQGTDMQGEGHVKMQAESRVMQLYANMHKGLPEPPEAGRGKERFFLAAFRLLTSCGLES
jgi:hypothetical protein